MNPFVLLLASAVSAQEAPETCAADAALLGALEAFLSEETGADGAERLGRLGDPRAVGPLAHGARTRALPVALAATRNLAGYGERGVGALAGLLGDGAVRQEVRKAAAHALGLASRPDAADALVAALDGDLPRPVRVEVVESVRRWYPDRAAGLERVVASDGTGWLVAGGAVGLGYALGSAGHFGQADLVGMGVVTGALAGGTFGFVGGRVWPMEAADAAFLTTSGIAATVGGTMVADALAEGDDDAFWLGGLAGDVAGFGLGWALRETHAGTVGDSGEAIALSAAGALGAGTAMTFLAPDSDSGSQLAGGLGFIGGMAVGHAAAPHVDLTGRDAGLLALGTTYGTLFGSLVPTGDRDRAGLPATGLALGWIASYGLAVPVEMPGDVTTGSFSGLTLGTLAGWGTGLFLTDPDARDTRARRQDVAAVTLAGGTAGLALGGWLAAENPRGIAANDVVISSIAAGWAGWQAIGWWTVADAGRDWEGIMPLAPGLVGSAVAIASPALDVGVERSLPAASLGLWGAYAGAVYGVLSDADEPLAWSLGASDAGLGIGILLMSPVVDAAPVVVGLADAGGVAGAATGALAAAFATDERDPILTASLVGAGVGALGGAVAGRALLHRSRDRVRAVGPWLPRPPALPGTWSVAPATIPDGGRVALGVGLAVTDW